MKKEAQLGNGCPFDGETGREEEDCLEVIRGFAEMVASLMGWQPVPIECLDVACYHVVFKLAKVGLEPTRP